MFNKKSIQFLPSDELAELTIKPPIPARTVLPDWYKEVPPPPKELSRQGRVTNLKSCVPFLDAMTHGYIQETWAEIVVTIKGDELLVEPQGVPNIIKLREKVATKIGPEFYPYEFVWQVPYQTRLPKGYSHLVTHPLNREDLPFRSLSAVIDSDNFYHSMWGNYPFYIKKGFEGVIPIGTPMCQIIPIKREPWQSEAIKFDKNDRESKREMLTRIAFGSYKKQFWQKKIFE